MRKWPSVWAAPLPACRAAACSWESRFVFRLRTWTKAQERLVGRQPDAVVARRLGRTRKSVEARRLHLGLRQRPNRRWTKAEERLLAQTLKAPRGRHAVRELAKKLGRSPVAVELHRRIKFGLVQGAPRVWTRREDRLLGTRSDKEVAQIIGCKSGVVSARRYRLGITSALRKPRPWTPAEDRLLGTAPDRIVGRKVGRKFSSVQHRRSQLGIAPAVSPWAWTRKEERLLGTKPDRELARQFGRTVAAVQARRVIRRIPSALPTARRWTPREDARLGTKTDAEIGRLLGRGAAGVRRRRRLLGIPLTQWLIGKFMVRKWTAAEEDLLGRLPDYDVADQLGRSYTSVAARRRSLRRPAIPSPVRRVHRARHRRKTFSAWREWTVAEELLLGTQTDRKVALQMGRTTAAVTRKRSMLGVRAFMHESKGGASRVRAARAVRPI